jgi:hypothetical protein
MKKRDMTIHRISFAFFGFIALFLATSQVFAFTGKDKIPPLKTEVSISKQDFESKSDLITFAPFKDEDLSYKIRLPKGWQNLDKDIIEGQTGVGILRLVSQFTSPPRIEHRSIFRVSVIDMDSLITVDDWFISYMLEMGFSIEGINIKSPYLTQAQYTVFEDDEPYIVRATITTTSAKIILAEYLVHQEMYELEKSEQIWAMTGFELSNPDTVARIPMKTFNFVDIAKFDYPANWLIQAPEITDISRMEATVINTKNLRSGITASGDELLGRIDISIISKDQGLSLTDEINILKENLKARKYKLGKFIETVEEKGINPLISSSRIDAYEVEGVSKRLAGYEYWVGVLQTKTRFYMIRLTTVSRGENFKSWAENVETYRVLLRSLGPASVEIDEPDANR